MRRGEFFMNENLISAPCGMNCSLCIAYQRDKKKCPGCTGPDENKPEHCISCHIKKCANLMATESGFCFACNKFPCSRLKNLDKRYRTKYGMSMIENLQSIETLGLADYIKMEREKWSCVKCGELLSVHREKCSHCKEPNRHYPGNT
jgi:hypothetical protein